MICEIVNFFRYYYKILNYIFSFGKNGVSLDRNIKYANRYGIHIYGVRMNMFPSPNFLFIEMMRELVSSEVSNCVFMAGLFILRNMSEHIMFNI